MAQPTPPQAPAPLPPWNWQDLEQTLYSLAETPNQSTVIRHFLSSMAREMPTDARAILLEMMHITMVMNALEHGSTGIAPPLPRRLHG